MSLVLSQSQKIAAAASAAVEMLENRQMFSANFAFPPAPAGLIGPVQNEHQAAAHAPLGSIFGINLPNLGDIVSSIGGAIKDVTSWVKNVGKPIYDKIKAVVPAIKTVLADFKQLIKDLGVAVAKIMEVFAGRDPKSAAAFVDAAAKVKKAGGPYRDQYYSGVVSAIGKGGALALQRIRAAEYVQRSRISVTPSSAPSPVRNYGNVQFYTREYRDAKGRLYVASRFTIDGNSATTLLAVG